MVPPAKSTSAGLCLALVLAVLLLAGCGGGDDPEGQSAGASTASSSAQAQGEANAAPAKSEKKEGERSSPKASRQPAAAAKGGGKQGPPIAQPTGAREPEPTPADIANATVADMTLTSPSLPPGSGEAAPLSRTYTCDGEGKWPALSWSGVPADSAELILYAMNLAPVGGKLFVDWAVAGIDPALTGIEAGKLPKGVAVGTNSYGKRGYEICPEGTEIHIFAIYALPRPLSPPPGFDARELRRRILDVSGNVGLYPVTYTRG